MFTIEFLLGTKAQQSFEHSLNYYQECDHTNIKSCLHDIKMRKLTWLYTRSMSRKKHKFDFKGKL